MNSSVIFKRFGKHWKRASKRVSNQFKESLEWLAGYEPVVREYFTTFKASFLKSVFKRKRQAVALLNSFLVSNEQRLSFLFFELPFKVAFFGLLLAFIFSFVNVFEFNLETIIGLGVSYYFLKEELPEALFKLSNSFRSKKK